MKYSWELYPTYIKWLSYIYIFTKKVGENVNKYTVHEHDT